MLFFLFHIRLPPRSLVERWAGKQRHTGERDAIHLESSCFSAFVLADHTRQFLNTADFCFLFFPLHFFWMDLSPKTKHRIIFSFSANLSAFAGFLGRVRTVILSPFRAFIRRLGNIQRGLRSHNAPQTGTKRAAWRKGGNKTDTTGWRDLLSIRCRTIAPLRERLHSPLSTYLRRGLCFFFFPCFLSMGLVLGGYGLQFGLHGAGFFSGATGPRSLIYND